MHAAETTWVFCKSHDDIAKERAGFKRIFRLKLSFSRQAGETLLISIPPFQL